MSRSKAPPLTEAAFQAQVVQYARLMGWKVFHPWISIKSAAGFPDLVLVRPPRLVFAELKRDGKEPTPAQVEWLNALQECGVEVYVWHPAGWERIERILSHAPS